MKYLIVVTDGAGDRPLDSIGGLTALQKADMRYINELAKTGVIGTVKTVPDNMPPGSDVANLSVMGYDPAIYHTGRSPLEAASMGIDMSPTDVAFRCNLITLTGDGDYEDLIIHDHSSGDISTKEAAELIQDVNKHFENENIKFYPGVSYRHCMIVKNGDTKYELVPPHDVLEKKAGDYLPKGEGSEFITDMMKKSYEFLSDHPINRKRAEKGLNPANTVWIWGLGKKPSLSSFYDKYGIDGAVISAVDLIKGIAVCAGLKSIDVPGATGTIDTDYEGKAGAAIELFKDGIDFVYIHVEAPDECSHQGDLAGKIKSLEFIDDRIIKPVGEYLKNSGEDYRILVVPDHRTPVEIRTHSSEPVPFVIYDSTDIKERNEMNAYNEVAADRGMHFQNGYELTDYFFR